MRAHVKRASFWRAFFWRDFWPRTVDRGGACTVSRHGAVSCSTRRGCGS